MTDSPPDQPPAGKQRSGIGRFFLKVCLMLFSIGVALLLGELAVRIYKPGYPGFGVPQAEHKVSPGLGFELIPNQQAYSVGFPATINSRSCRGPEIRPDAERRSGDLRVLCVGDSITYGHCIGDEDTYPYQLQEILAEKYPDRRPEAINGGVQRYAIYQYLDWLRLRGLAFKPDIVTMGIYYNDFAMRPQGDYSKEYDNEREKVVTAFRSRWPRTYLALKNSAFFWMAYNTSLRALKPPSGKRFTDRMLDGEATEKDEKVWASVREELAAFKTLSEEHQFKPLVITITIPENDTGLFPQSLYPARILKYCDELGLPAVSTQAVFEANRKAGNNPNLEWDNHLSRHGCRLVAEEIIKAIEPMIEQLPVE